jgi:hypothetical protein
MSELIYFKRKIILSPISSNTRTGGRERTVEEDREREREIERERESEKERKERERDVILSPR